MFSENYPKRYPKEGRTRFDFDNDIAGVQNELPPLAKQFQVCPEEILIVVKLSN